MAIYDQNPFMVHLWLIDGHFWLKKQASSHFTKSCITYYFEERT